MQSGRQTDLVAPLGLGDIAGLVCRGERRARLGETECVRKASRERDVTDRNVGLSIDQTRSRETRARAVEARHGPVTGDATKKQHEFLSAMTRNMASIVGDACQRLRYGLDHAIPRVMPMVVVDGLEMTDVADGYRERFHFRASIAVLACQDRLEGATIGKTVR